MRKPSFADSTDDLTNSRGSKTESSSHRKVSFSQGKVPSEVINKRDVFGRTILHICVLCDDPDSLRYVLRSSESKNILTATDYESGWNILHYIFYHKRLRCFNVLMASLENSSATISPLLFDLLKKKDRSGAVPVSLLQNDTKDLYWMPQYINEKNKFHMVHRFLDSSNVTKSEDTPVANDTVANGTDPTPIAPATAEAGSKKNPPFHRTVHHDWWCETRGGSDVYVFGENTNSNLGTGDTHDRTFPSRISSMAKKDRIGDDMSLCELLKKPRYKFIKMSKYHSVLCTTDGRLYTCGIGSRGRLGQGSSSNVGQFKEVSFPNESQPVVWCAVSNHHTVAVTSSGALYAWGQNTVNQLGFTSSARSNSFKKISDVYENSPVEITTGDHRRSTSQIRGVAVSKIHSIAFSSDSVYFWGLNIGQIVLPQKGDFTDHRVNDKSYRGVIVSQPKEVQIPSEIKLVATCETCTCVVTVTNDIYIFYLGQRVKLPKISPRVSNEVHFDFFKPSTLTSAPSIVKVVMKSHAAVHILLESGDVMTFSVPPNDIKALRNVRYASAWSASDISMRAVDIDNSFDGSLMICVRNGSVFLRTASASNPATAAQRRGSSTNLTSISFSPKRKFKKLEGLNRVLRVSCNDTFTSFAFLRDDIDTLPLKLQRNDFFKDMEYLSPFVEPDMYRKQDQLLDTDHDLNCYVTDFLYPSVSKSSGSDDEKLLILSRLKAGFASFEEKEESNDTKDRLRKRMLEKFSSNKNKEPATDSVFQKITDSDLVSHRSLLKASLNNVSPLFPYEWSREKFCDGKIEFAQFSDYAIGIHTSIFRKRSKLCRQIFSPQEEGEYFVHQHIEGVYNPESKTILFRSKVEPLAVLVFVYFVYTNTLIDFWQDYSSTDPAIDTVRRIKKDFLTLMSLFKMDTLYEKDEIYLQMLQERGTEDVDADVIVALADGETVKCSSSIVSRSAFFETILSGRWETNNSKDSLLEEDLGSKYVGLEQVNLLHMRVILKHLQGCHDLHVFDDARTLVTEADDSDEFVNFLLEMIEIADELLLVQLKHLCELAIKEFITIDNVLILLGHADWSGARKLFISCCWYIYNNLELVLFDQNLRDLDGDVVQSLEVQMKLLDNCKHPHFITGIHGEVDGNVFCQSDAITKRNLVQAFMKNSTNFNEVFMSDARGFCKFEPLIDVKVESTTSDKRRKSSSRRMSSKGNSDVLADVQRLSISTPIPQNGHSLRRENEGSMTKESDCAIADEDFEVVTNGKRKSKSRASHSRASENTMIENSSENENQSSGQSTPIHPREETSDRENRSTRRPSTTPKPILGPVLGEAMKLEKKQTKIKFAPPMKLSQKERRKLRDGNESISRSSEPEINTEQGFRNPWKIPKPDTDMKTASVKGPGKLNSLPVLGQKIEPTPKLSAIILEETTRVAEEREPAVTQTLQEIQQEQEFAKWWEEECKRVQQLESQQMGGFSGSSEGQESRRGGRSRRGRGKRG